MLTEILNRLGRGDIPFSGESARAEAHHTVDLANQYISEIQNLLTMLPSLEAKSPSGEAKRTLFEAVEQNEKQCEIARGNSKLQNPDAVRDACSKLTEAVPAFRQNFAEVGRGQASLDNLYQQLRKVVVQIEQQAQQIQ
jgi:hypothetical protein